MLSAPKRSQTALPFVTLEGTVMRKRDTHLRFKSNFISYIGVKIVQNSFYNRFSLCREGNFFILF